MLRHSTNYFHIYLWLFETLIWLSRPNVRDLDDYIMIYERNKASEDTNEVYSSKNILEIYFHIHKLLFKVSDSNDSMPLQLAGV